MAPKNKKDKNFPPKADQPRAEKGMKESELLKQHALLLENMRVIRFKAEGSKSKNVKELYNLRKDVARILTEINKK
jgi:ribosomal protein L29